MDKEAVMIDFSLPNTSDTLKFIPATLIQRVEPLTVRPISGIKTIISKVIPRSNNGKLRFFHVRIGITIPIKAAQQPIRAAKNCFFRKKKGSPC